MNKKGLIVATGTVFTALALSGCGTDNNAMNHRKNVGYERVNFDNRPTNPYSVNDRYENNMNYPNNRDNYARQNVHFGNDRINEGLSSEYTNDGIVRDGKNGRNANYYTNNYSLTDQVRYNTNNNMNNTTNTPIVPFTNISTNTRMSEGDRKYADQISRRVEQMANVKSASSVVVGDQVLIAIDLNDKNVDESALRSKIKDTLTPYTSGKNVHVTFDGNIRNDIMNIPNDTTNILKNTKNDVKDMYRNVKHGVKDIANPNH
ncbi:YhcN/YlaJ family sporulation lipoprotein [Bacillus sp. EAC]|uniref:YhcN/YlaJ family sporulation lipoprotein n=1 Tax=Bacillus sp. EAC TaxID=1978338 RepID=UPI000B431EAC|nr:YhcN/YlaJ family sporulation lipoprotein [Bacillus sp. EAC]